MRIAYLDCIAGASGDMLLGALVDAGLPEATLREKLAALHLEGFDLQCRRVLKNGFGATKVDVLVDDDVPERHLADVERIVRDSDLPPTLQQKALAVFRRLCQAEATIHGTSLEEVHLHELGGLDTVVDVVGVLAGLEALEIGRIYASPLPMGRGFVRGAHGRIPLPAPATLALLEGVPIVGSELDTELVTPTGAVLLVSLAEAFGPIPAMTLTSVGYGAGTRDLSIPNVVRLLVGTQATPGDAAVETLIMLETNIDDLNPEIYDHVVAQLFQASALDVFLSSVQMKKNRPGTWLHVLSRAGDADALTAILFAETSTLGVRRHIVTRYALSRSIHQVATPYGPVRVKVATWDQGYKAAPEYDDCRRLAESHRVPLRQVYRAAERAAEEMALQSSQAD
jgi:uncharacterized protein (TIGR00299 family) protein